MSQDSDGQPAGTAETVRVAARDARQRWAREVSQALQEQRLSIHAAAKAIGISPGRLQAWLSQDVEPSPRAMPELARVIGRGHLYLLQLLDWLPAELADVPLRLAAAERLREAVADAAGWVAAAGGTAGAAPLADAVGPFLTDHPDWEIRTRAVRRGVHWPMHVATELGFCAPSDVTPNLSDVTGTIGAMITRAGAHWLNADELRGHPWAEHTDLVLSAPVLGANRPRGLRPVLTVPPSIVVVGIPDSAAGTVAALLAEALDWAHVDVRALADERFGLPADAPADVVDRARTTVVQQLLGQPDGAARFAVWSCQDPKPILQTFRSLGPDLPLVVLLRAPGRVLDVVATRLGAEQNPEVNLIETAQSVVGRTLTDGRDPSTYLVLDLPEAPFAAPNPDADATVDAAVDLARAAAAWLHQKHGAPPPTDLPGLLGRISTGSA